jgi:hypothetical protein
VATGILLAVLLAAPAALAAPGPVWKVMSVSNPTNFKPGDTEDLLIVTAANVGDGPTDGSTITLSDKLPSGLTAVKVFGVDAYKEPVTLSEGGLSCSAPPEVQCTDSRRVDPGDTLIMKITVSVATGATQVATEATASGGGAPNASVGNAVTIGTAQAPYGVAPGGLVAAISSGQAGAHANVTTGFVLNTAEEPGEAGGAHAKPVATPKDIRFDLPPGLVGSTVGMPRCPIAEVVNASNCPADTMVGTATVTFGTLASNQTTAVAPVFNIAPSPGEPAAFAFDALFFSVRLDTSVLSDGNYGVRVTASNLTEGEQVVSTWVTIWGVPADHSGSGEDQTVFNLINGGSFGGPNTGQTRVPLLTNPQQCVEPLSATVSTDSWTKPGVFVFAKATSMGSLTGCDRLSFRSSFTILPDTLEAGAPAGYSFN